MDAVGRPRTRPPGESIALGFKAEPALVEALDKEAERMSALRPAGSANTSRTEVIKIILHEWLAKQTKRGQQ
jgi:hypothetical protein